MQDHIKRLAVEAGFTVGRDEWVLQEMLERFAQAVARECAQIASNTIEQGGECAYASAQAIGARFGLEG